MKKALWVILLLSICLAGVPSAPLAVAPSRFAPSRLRATPEPTPTPEPVEAMALVQVIRDGVTLTAAADSKGYPNRILKRGDVAEQWSMQIGADGEWWRYIDFDGVKGYIPAGSAQIMTRDEIADWQATPTPSPTPSPSPTPTPKPVRAGDIVTFGHYEQDGNISNGQEPIEWQVLEVRQGMALLLSRYGLDAQPYNTTRTSVTWEQCSLRTWLNGTFLDTAFSGVAQGAILTTAVDNSRSQCFDFTTVISNAEKPNGGNNTQDKVFLLSYAEANKYLGVQEWQVFGAVNNIRSRVSPTAYAKNQGAWTNDDDYKTAEGATAGSWWLRSPGYNQSSAAGVGCDGALYDGDVSFDEACVRPALWVNLESRLILNLMRTAKREE